MYFTGKNRKIFELKNTVEILTALTDEYCNEILIGFFFFFLAYVIILLIKNKKSNYPPGPIGLPLIGYLPFLSEDVHLKLIELGKKYGDVFSIRLGSQNVVVLHGGDAIREALSKPEFMGRPPFGTLQFTNPLTAFFGDNMLLWKEQRRFVMKSLKNLGIRKTKFEEDVMAEINNFLEVLKLYNGQPIDLKTALQASISNNICALVFGKRFECNDPKRLFLDQNLEKAMNSLSMISSYSLFPWIRHIPFFQRFLSIEISRIRYDVLRKHFRKELDEHKKSLDPKHIRDYIDIFLLATESRKGKDLNTNFTDDMLLANILDLFVGGSETLTSSILWFVYSMAAFPDIQKKIVQEIIEIVGPGESPEFHHMKYMPYTYATIMELMRWKTIAALDKRYTVADVSINGYNIPKGTIILANFWNAHNDSRYWFEPEKFKPERFLSKDGKSVVKSKYYMPFSLGKRNCPGESMAYIELFLYITSILQKFRIEFPNGKKPVIKGKLNITYRSEPFLVQFKEITMEYLYKTIIPKMRNEIGNITPKLEVYRYEILLGVFAFFLAYAIMVFVKKAKSNYPPGPMGLPIVGYLPFVSNNLHLDFTELGKKYGDVFSVKLGSQNIVVLHGTEGIREAFNKTEFLGRPPSNSLERINPYSPFFGGDFHAWKEQRRFVVQSMKDLGLGKTKIEDEVMDEVNHFVKVLKSHSGQPIDVKKPLSPSMSNNISALVFGKRYDYDNPDRQFLDENLEETNEFVSETSLEFLFPWIKHIPFIFKNLNIERSFAAFQRIHIFFKKEVDAHAKTLDHGLVRDFIDRYLLEIQAQKEKNPNSTFHYDMLISNVLDIFGAGSETVRTSILWFIYCMAAFPDIQKKVHQEIMEVLGSDRSPEFQDLKSMPYTHAVMLEIMRWKTIVPLNLQHYTLGDSTAGGYDIPKGTIVVANFWNAHHDPRYWKEPEKFNPERFLSKDGKSVVKSNNFMPFSTGRRACPGESMAYIEMFLYFTSILQKFEIAFPPGAKVDFSAKLTVTYRLDPFMVRFIPRN
ncbi:uncharacterized protein LOC129971757 [Argiope bruennichi]|uniref:uncharacterized protein LOC129971757 n=1 Tax=Argiope bruennichi TaxID=94029 RepID=UPI0024941A21|nr:uncharacterized protein LOC129971757 [Argiope bruennichi]